VISSGPSMSLIVISLLLVLESQVTSCWDCQETENVRAARTSCPRAPFPGSPPLVSPHSTDRRDLHPEILMLNRAGERTQADPLHSWPV
jgi:hypothetical protein